jgi:hypothetical protein
MSLGFMLLAARNDNAGYICFAACSDNTDFVSVIFRNNNAGYICFLARNCHMGLIRATANVDAQI